MKMPKKFVAATGTVALCAVLSLGASPVQAQAASGGVSKRGREKNKLAEELVPVFSESRERAVDELVEIMKDGSPKDPLNVLGVDVLFGEMALARPDSDPSALPDFERAEMRKDAEFGEMGKALPDYERASDPMEPASGKIIPEPDWREFEKPIECAGRGAAAGRFVASWKGDRRRGIKGAKVTVQSGKGALAGAAAFVILRAGKVARPNEAKEKLAGASVVGMKIGLLISAGSGGEESAEKDFDAVVTVFSDGKSSLKCRGGGKKGENMGDEKGQ